MQKTIYIPDEERDLLNTARRILGESSVSALIVRTVKDALERERSDIKDYNLPDRNRIVKVIGREIFRDWATLRVNESGREVWGEPRGVGNGGSGGDRFVWWFTAYQSMKGRIVVHVEKHDKEGDGTSGWVETWDNISHFSKKPIFQDDSGVDRELPTTFLGKVVNKTGPVLEIID
ncbi:hypothetical protein ACFLT7_00415 [candidate division KSB1 bacterium]